MEELLLPVDLEQIALQIDVLLASFAMNATTLVNAVNTGTLAQSLALQAANFTNYLFHHRCAMLRLAEQDIAIGVGSSAQQSFEAV